jgi:hypothetical protein
MPSFRGGRDGCQAHAAERLSKMNFSTPGAGSLQQARDYVSGQHTAWGTLVKEIGLQPE